MKYELLNSENQTFRINMIKIHLSLKIATNLNTFIIINEKTVKVITMLKTDKEF